MRYTNRQAKQESNETLDTFHTRLRQLSQTCEFDNMDNEIVSQIILSCQSQRLRRRALRETMTLDQLLTIGRSFETSEREADLVEAGRQEATYAVSDRGRRDNYKQSYPNHHDHRHPSKQHPSPGQQSQPQRRQPQQGNRNCWFCGGPFPHKTTCPATGKECRHCKKMGHFASVCRSA